MTKEKFFFKIKEKEKMGELKIFYNYCTFLGIAFAARRFHVCLKIGLKQIQIIGLNNL